MYIHDYFVMNNELNKTFLILGQTNVYFNVSFETINKIICTQWHLSQQKNRSTVMCNAVYWSCQQTITHDMYTSSSSTVNIDLPERGYYCYAINASNGTFTILVEGAIKFSKFSTVIDITCMPSSDLLFCGYEVVIIG